MAFPAQLDRWVRRLTPTERWALAAAALSVVGAGLVGLVLQWRARKATASRGHARTPAAARERDALSAYEAQLEAQLVPPGDSAEGFASVGGLEEQIKLIEQSVILPLSHPHLFAHSGD